MNFFRFDGLVVLLLEDSFRCKCDGCAQRCSNGGLTFLLVEQNAWSEHLTFNFIKSRFEVLNPCISVSDELLVRNVIDCLLDGTCKFEMDKSKNRLNALFECQSDELPIFWRIEADQASSQMIMCHLVMPLFLALEQSNKRELNLISSLERMNKRLHISGGESFHYAALQPSAGPSASQENNSNQLSDEQDESTDLSLLTVSQAVVDGLSKASQLLKKRLEIPNTSTAPSANATAPLSSVAEEKVNTVEDLEKRRQEELQHKLARELAKSKSKRVKKTGILRK